MKNMLTLARRDKMALGFYLSETDLTIAELVGLSGYDYMRIDTEHTLMDPSKILNLLRICTTYDVPTLVRVSNPADITRVLDAGASGILVPDIETRQQAEDLVQRCKYYPVGTRGMGMESRHTQYGLADIKQFMKKEPEKVAVCVQIESVKGVRNAAEILSVAGIDMVAVGKADLSQSMGIPGEMGTPAVLDAEEAIIRMALERGIHPMVTAGSPEQLERYRKMGVRIATIAFDVPFLFQALRDHIARFRTFHS